MLFAEHGRAPDRRLARKQDCLKPAWKPFACGCHLNRSATDLIRSAGFRTR